MVCASVSPAARTVDELGRGDSVPPTHTSKELGGLDLGRPTRPAATGSSSQSAPLQKEWLRRRRATYSVELALPALLFRGARFLRGDTRTSRGVRRVATDRGRSRAWPRSASENSPPSPLLRNNKL